MIDRNDCLLLLSELKQKGIEDKTILLKALKSPEVNIEVLDYINSNRQLDLTKFYEKLRHSYNTKKSILYKNLMLELDENNIDEILTTLSSLSLQIFLFSKNLENKELFYKHARLTEIEACLYEYSKTYSLINCIKLLELIKADIKVLESVNRK